MDGMYRARANLRAADTREGGLAISFPSPIPLSTATNSSFFSPPPNPLSSSPFFLHDSHHLIRTLHVVGYHPRLPLCYVCEWSSSQYSVSYLLTAGNENTDASIGSPGAVACGELFLFKVQFQHALNASNS
jgi:hypothetical protein